MRQSNKRCTNVFWWAGQPPLPHLLERYDDNGSDGRLWNQCTFAYHDPFLPFGEDIFLGNQLVIVDI